MSQAPTLPLIGPEMTIAFASEWAKAWCDAIQSTPNSHAVDLAGVTDFDSSGMQLLMATRNALKAQGHALHIHRVSEPVRNAMGVFGLTDCFMPANAGLSSEEAPT